MTRGFHRIFLIAAACGMILMSSRPLFPAKAGGNADVANPFPRTIMDHRVFTVFRSANLLGYVFRDGGREILGPRYWEGKETETAPAEKEIKADFNERQITHIQDMFPGVSFRKGQRVKAVYRVVLRGVRVRTLAKPVLMNEYRDLTDIEERGFISSLLVADEIVMQAFQRTAEGLKAAEEKLMKTVLEGNFTYSREHSGVVTARNAVIGYILSTPSADDLARPAENLRELRTLAVFPLEFRGGGEKYRFVGAYLKDLFEEALIGIPDIVIDSDRPDETKYHLKGSVRGVGDRVQIELTLFNTYSQKQAAKISRLTALNSRGIADTLSEAVVTLSEALKIELREKDLWRQEQVIRMAESFTMMRDYHRAQKLRARHNYDQAMKTIVPVAKKYPENIYVQRELGDVLYADGKYREALPVYMKVEELCITQKHPDRGTVFLDLGRTYKKLEQFEKAEEYLLKGQEARTDEYEPDRLNAIHPRTAEAYQARAYLHMEIASYSRRQQTRNTQYGAAEGLLRKAGEILMNRYGADSRRLIPLYAGLYVLYIETGRNDESLDLSGKCLRLTELKYGRDSVETAVKYAQHGALLYRTDRNQKALVYLNNALTLLRKKLKGENHGKFSMLYGYYGNVYASLNDYKKAELYLKKSLAIDEKIHGKDSKSANSTIAKLVDVEMRLGKTGEAVAYMKRNGLKEHQIKEVLRIYEEEKSRKP